MLLAVLLVGHCQAAKTQQKTLSMCYILFIPVRSPHPLSLPHPPISTRPLIRCSACQVLPRWRRAQPQAATAQQQPLMPPCSCSSAGHVSGLACTAACQRALCPTAPQDGQTTLGLW